MGRIQRAPRKTALERAASKRTSSSNPASQSAKRNAGNGTQGSRVRSAATVGFQTLRKSVSVSSAT